MSRTPKLEAITRMLNAFPPTSDNYDLLLDTYEQQLAEVSTEAAERAVRRFLAGDVEGQSKRFAPTIAEFMTEARDCEHYLGILNRAPPSIALPKWRGDGQAPFEKLIDKTKASHAHLPVLHEDINFDQWRKLSASRAIPVGAVWVACLGTVYGPDPKLPAQQYDR
jgi:hypothetical protein